MCVCGGGGALSRVCDMSRVLYSVLDFARDLILCLLFNYYYSKQKRNFVSNYKNFCKQNR